ncbi:sulfotransferase family protein [Streptomyces sp. AF1A]|jgi:hypothetical protein|uniref:sulfotransferase-like domain-containing protein n=1 Tax=Streptomyces sp. AF1A TaxID=3394350 RepID=UPI0039BC41C7
MPLSESGPRLLVLWSPPRCRSTAFARMMHERGDFTVLHEPFSHLKDFGTAEVAGVSCTDERTLMDELLSLAERTPVFVKDTTDFHYPVVLTADDFLREATHTFILRHPREAIASHHRLNPQLTRDEIGFARVREIHEAVRSAGSEPVVIDSDDFVDRPEATVRAYCRAVGLEFLPQALSWSPSVLSGWEKTLRWHTEVAASTGVKRRPSAGATEVEDHPVLGPYYRYHLPHYHWLRERRLRIAES